MGLNCVAVLLNDCCGELERDGGRYGGRMSYAMQNWSPITLEGWFGAGRVISRDHADGYQIVIVHGNTGERISEANDLPYWTLKQMAECLNRHGWRAKPPVCSRKPAEKVS